MATKGWSSHLSGGCKKESHIEEALKMVLEGEQDLAQTGGPRVL